MIKQHGPVVVVAGGAAVVVVGTVVIFAVLWFANKHETKQTRQ